MKKCTSLVALALLAALVLTCLPAQAGDIPGTMSAFLKSYIGDAGAASAVEKALKSSGNYARLEGIYKEGARAGDLSAFMTAYASLSNVWGALDQYYYDTVPNAPPLHTAAPSTEGIGGYGGYVSPTYSPEVRGWMFNPYHYYYGRLITSPSGYYYQPGTGGVYHQPGTGGGYYPGMIYAPYWPNAATPAPISYQEATNAIPPSNVAYIFEQLYPNPTDGQSYSIGSFYLRYYELGIVGPIGSMTYNARTKSLSVPVGGLTLHRDDGTALVLSAGTKVVIPVK